MHSLPHSQFCQGRTSLRLGKIVPISVSLNITCNRLPCSPNCPRGRRFLWLTGGRFRQKVYEVRGKRRRKHTHQTYRSILLDKKKSRRGRKHPTNRRSIIQLKYTLGHFLWLFLLKLSIHIELCAMDWHDCVLDRTILPNILCVLLLRLWKLNIQSKCLFSWWNECPPASRRNCIRTFSSKVNGAKAPFSKSCVFLRGQLKPHHFTLSDIKQPLIFTHIYIEVTD